ncbi:MAG: filamentous hemagglutinin N-terminal domain-containing protein, partial [Nitrosomonas sp.]
FYSFSDFSIGTTDAAWFKLNTPDLANVISRVTGGSESLIDGKLQMTNVGSTPSFYFINPAGITFSSGASVDVPGSFYVSTASNLKFSDNSQFSANETNASSLSSANPESFGFLGNETGSLILGNSSLMSTALSFRSSSDIAFVGNQVQINNTSIMSEAIRNNDLTQNGLDLQLIATGKEAATVELNAPPSYVTTGNLTIQNSTLDVSGNSSGSFVASADNLSTNNSFLYAHNTGIDSMSANDGIDIQIRSELIVDDSVIASYAKNEGNAGDVKVSAGLLSISRNGVIGTSTFDKGNAGAVMVNAKDIVVKGLNSQFVTGIASDAVRDSNGGHAGDVSVISDTLRLLDGGVIRSNTFSQNRGNAGNVSIKAVEIEVNGDAGSSPTRISSNASRGSNGQAGNVTVKADSLNLFNGGSITSALFSGTHGNSGVVIVDAKQIVIDGQDSTQPTGIASVAEFGSKGHAGTVNVTSDSLKLINNGHISSSTFGSGDAGMVSVEAGEILIDGTRSEFFTGISSDAGEEGIDNDGNGGEISIKADNLYLLGGGAVSSTTSTRGNAGEITINTDHLVIDGLEDDSYTGINTEALEGSDGDAGNININTSTLSLRNDGTISSATQYKGKAGIVSIYADDIKLSRSEIFSDALAKSSGQTGNIIIYAENLSLYDNSEINISNAAAVSSSDALVPTDIKIYTSNLNLIDSRITTDSSGNVGAGNISVNFEDLDIDHRIIDEHGSRVLFMSNSLITTSVYGSTGNGGDINLASNFLILDTGFIKANTLAADASGGDINIQVPIIIPSGNLLFVGGNTPFEFQPLSGLNVIQAVAPDGVNGTINVTTPQLNLNAMLTNLLIESFDSNVLNRDICEVSDSSSLLQSGRGAQPVRAKDLLLSPVF